MFVVRRFRILSIYIYIFAVTHICIYAYDCVYICIVCVWSCITRWHTWTMLLHLHFAEAYGSRRFRGKMFLMAFSEERWIVGDRKKVKSGCFSTRFIHQLFFLHTFRWFYLDHTDKSCFFSSNCFVFGQSCNNWSTSCSNKYIFCWSFWWIFKAKLWIICWTKLP